MEFHIAQQIWAPSVACFRRYRAPSLGNVFVTELGENLRRLRTERGLSQAALAETVGVSQGAISQIEMGRVLSPDALPRIANALNVPISDLDPSWDPIRLLGATLGGTPVEDGRRMPVYASAEASGGALIMILNRVDSLSMPAPLMTVSGGYGIFVSGESMSPAFDPGDIALVHPHFPARRGDDVILLHKTEGRARTAMIRRMLRALPETWIVRQFNPAKELDLPRSEWPVCNVIVGKYTRR